MKRLLLLASILLLGLTPAQKRVVLNQFSDSQCDNLIQSAGPTLWLDANYGITLTASNTVSAWASRVGTISFTQSTAASQPSLTNADGREQLFINSGDWTDTTNWTSYGETGRTASTFSCAGQNCRISQAIPTVAGQSYTLSGWIRAVSGNTALELLHVNSATGNSTAITASGTSTFFSTTVLGRTGGGDVTFGIRDPNAAGHGVFEGLQMHVRSALADQTYAASGAYRIYRGMNGRRAVNWSATKAMTSTATTGTIFGAGAKTLFLTSRVNLAATQLVIGDALSYWQIQTLAGPKLRFLNYDANNDTADSTITLSASTVFTAWHDGTNIYDQANGGAITSAASGNTGGTASTLRLGTGSDMMTGDLQTLLTFNKVLPSDTRAKINKCLCRKAGASC